jgi:hypothetical protein
MPLQIPEGTYQAKLRFSCTGDAEEMISTIAVQGREPGDRDLVEVAHAVYAAWLGAWPPVNLCNDYTFLGVDVTEGSNDGTGETASWDEPVDGVGTWRCLPSNCAMLIRKKTALGGRANIGRMFLPAGYIDVSTIEPTGWIGTVDYDRYQSNIDQFFENLVDETTTPGSPIADFLPVLLHSVLTRDPTPIVKFAIDRIIATQRQRMRN